MIFSLLVNAVILLLSCVVLILYFYIHFLCRRHYISSTLAFFGSLKHWHCLLWKSRWSFFLFHYFCISFFLSDIVSPGCGVRAFLMHFSSVVLTHIMSWPNFSITYEFFINLGKNLCIYMGTWVGVKSKGSMSLENGCNARSYSFAIATHVLARLWYYIWTFDHLIGGFVHPW